MKEFKIEKCFNDDDVLIWERHFHNGNLHDLPDGTAAWQERNSKGGLIVEDHYQNGKLHDLPDGTAARRWWDDEDGTIWEMHYQNGKLKDFFLLSNLKHTKNRRRNERV